MDETVRVSGQSVQGHISNVGKYDLIAPLMTNWIATELYNLQHHGTFYLI